MDRLREGIRRLEEAGNDREGFARYLEEGGKLR
jgi:hypothetical protein